ncbi:fimbrillin family protein [Sphingobacterium siyangense]|uniref:fimbrillin family protein n=1 Tax=Sphingobacterium siyangense TaxID=459529 RepID=UPI002FDECB3F
MYKIVYFLLAVFSLLSCKQSDDLPLEMSDISLKIGARTAHAGLSNSSVWADGDEMGLFMMASGQSNLSLGMEYNRKYTYSAGGAAFFLSGQPIYYPTTGQVDIVAYAPYRQVTGNTLSIDLLDQAHNIPLAELKAHIAELPVDKPIVVHCASGYRSAIASSLINEWVPKAQVWDIGEHIKSYKQSVN